MSGPDTSPPETRAPGHTAPGTPAPGNPDRLRADIDAGLGGDKAPGSDPSAAPLGTDAEAGGTPPTAEEVAKARADETRAWTEAADENPNAAAGGNPQSRHFTPQAR